MATARPGWSRRAQYGLFFSFLAVIAGIIVGLVMLTMSLVAPQTFERVRGAALDVTGPVAGALHEVTATASGIFTGAGNYWDAASQNAALKRDRRAMLQRMVEARAIFQENLQLKATLQLREHERTTLAAGRIVGSSFNSPRRFAILSAGSRDGVRVGMPVRSADGLVGRIIDAGALASRVLLVSDRANIVPARLKANKVVDNKIHISRMVVITAPRVVSLQPVTIFFILVFSNISLAVHLMRHGIFMELIIKYLFSHIARMLIICKQVGKPFQRLGSCIRPNRAIPFTPMTRAMSSEKRVTPFCRGYSPRGLKTFIIN